MTITAKNIGRINVWPTYDTAREADTEESKFVGQLTVWRTNEEARANISHEEEGGGGGGTPAWVPANAVIHIDLVGGTPQGRAYIAGTGEVAVDTLLGADPNTDGYATTEYNSEWLVEGDGMDQAAGVAFIGAALSKLLAGATVRHVSKRNDPSKPVGVIFWMMSVDNECILEVQIKNVPPTLFVQSFNTSVTGTGTVNTAGAINVVAYTVAIASRRLEAAVNGAAPAILAIPVEDLPVGSPLAASLFDQKSDHSFVQSITFYDPLPSTAGLSELSEP